jgi:hypothetical protein
MRKFKNALVLYQSRAGFERHYYVEVLEGDPTVHSNILFTLPASGMRHIDGLRRSSLYGPYLHIQSAEGTDWFVGYTSKERTPQAQYASQGKLGPRLPGSHPLGKGGGDRVRLSRHLEVDMAQAGLLRPHTHTYAARGLPPQPASAMVPQAALEPRKYGLFNDLPAAHAPARHVGPSRPQVKRAVCSIEQAVLQLDYPPDAVALLRNLAPTHAQIAAKIGRSRQQVTNIIAGRFGPSPEVVRRVLELSRAA